MNDRETAELSARLARLRGGHKPSPLGARNLEQSARNPACLRRRALDIAGIAPMDIAGTLVPSDSRHRQSVLTVRAGNAYEAEITRAGADRILGALRDAGVLGPQESRVVSVDHLPRALRHEETRRLLRAKLRGDPQAPNLILQARLAVPFAGRQEFVCPDILVARDEESMYAIGDIKAYSDYKTDPASIRGGARQVAVGMVALAAELEALGTPDALHLVPSRGYLILQRRGGPQPSVHGYQLDEARFLREYLRRDVSGALDEIEVLLRPGETLIDSEVVRRVPNHYRTECREYCPLAPDCARQAVEDGHVTILGTGALAAIPSIPTIGHAARLMAERDAHPTMLDEERDAARLHRAYRAWQEALHG